MNEPMTTGAFISSRTNEANSIRFDEPPLRTQVLAEASKLIVGDRNEEYGEPEENFGNIAALWAVILGIDVTPQQVALCMMMLKVARLKKTPIHRDTHVDAAAYAALAFELAKKSNQLKE